MTNQQQGLLLACLLVNRGLAGVTGGCLKLLATTDAMLFWFWQRIWTSV